MSDKKSQTLQKKYGHLKLRDLAQAGQVTVGIWELPDPDRAYRADAVGVTRQWREVTATFAQVLPGSDNVVNAVSVSLPLSQVIEGSASFEAIRGRLERHEFSQSELDGVTLKLERLNTLDHGSYLGLRADIVRAACGDETAVLDFFSLPTVPKALVEARPNEVYRIEGQIRVTCSPLTLAVFLNRLEVEVSRDGK